jgi:N utilization substance protein B
MPKKSPRHLSRSLALQAIYHYKMNEETITSIENYLNINNEHVYTTANYELMHFLIENSISQFDTLLNSYSKHSQRDVKDIDLIEQIILVIAAVELKDNLSVPAKVVINEAVELAKLYGANDSYKFINGLVDKLASTSRPAEMKS